MKLFCIPMLKTPRKIKILQYILLKNENVFKHQSNHITLQYFLQEVSARFYFLVKITSGKVSINFTGDKGFYILLQHSTFVIRPHVIHDV